MEDHLNLLLVYQNIKKTYQIKIKQGRINLNRQQIFARIKDFLQEMGKSVSTFLTFWVESRGIRQNLFNLFKKEFQLRLNETESGQFEVKLYIEQGCQKYNLIKSFNQNFQNYQRIKNSIQRIKSESHEYQRNKQQKATRNLDIAFFFADPLVQINLDKKTYELKVKNEVSYQVEYDQFIEMVKGQEFRRNLKIEMLVATETNIKNTLAKGVSILHFACHGQTNWLEIENQKKFGQQVTLEKEKLLALLKNGYLPKVIIFNACKSQNLAKKIAQQINHQRANNSKETQILKQNKIITIGYKGNANDKYCQKFTKDFYMGVFVYEKAVRQTFNQIKQEITIESPQEGKKLCIFPEAEDMEFEEAKISQPTQQNINYIVKWNMLENLRRDDCLGVKKEMHRFIQSLNNNESMSYIFLIGEKNSGKTNFMTKTRIYTINRKVFTDQLVIDLKNKKNSYFTETLLQMKLDYQSLLHTWRANIEKKFKDERVSCLVVIDHSQNLVQYQYSDFTKYVQEKIKQKVRWGKIVVITRNVYPYEKKDEIRHQKAILHMKEKENITAKELKDFTSRYFGKDYQDKISRIKQLRGNIPHLVLVKALKLCSSPLQLEENIKRVENPEPDSFPEFMQQSQINSEIKRLNKQVTKLLQNTFIQLKENHHVYISTIFEEIAANNYVTRHSNLLQKTRQEQKEQVSKIVKEFRQFFERAFCYQPKQSRQNLKQLARLSFRIAGLCYLKQFLFKEHMLICQKMRVMAISLLLSPFLMNKSQGNIGQVKNELKQVCDVQIKHLQVLLSQYRIKILLTLYSYFTECQDRLDHQKGLSEETRLALEQCCKKETIIQNEMYEQIHKGLNANEAQNSEIFVRKFKILNKIIQQIHFHPKYTLLHQNQSMARISDDYLESLPAEDYVHISIERIYAHHAKIDEYWKSYQSLKQINMKGQSQILSKDSMIILFLNIIKLINFNQVELEYLHSMGQSYFKREMIQYIAQYVKILRIIDQSQVFPQRNYSHSDYVIWKFPENTSIKMLFKKYFKLFVNVYFQLQKIRQNLTKDYSLKIFNHLLNQCDSHPKINTVPIKNDIQTHKDQQFLGNISCQTYISIPLVSQKNKIQKLNVQRFQSHIFRFQEEFFATLERQIKKDIFLLRKQLFAQKQQPQRSLIQLIICDCNDNSIQCQSATGKLQFIEKSSIRSWPNAPIVIIFGVKVRSFFDEIYKNQESILITIDLEEARKPIQHQLQGSYSVEERIQILEQYSFKLKMSYSLLQHFYTSFCKHFFMVDHSCFVQQVQSSFYLAKAEALIKTKIRFERQSKRQLSFLINQSVKKIEMSVSEEAKKQILNKPAYHFMFKVINEASIMKVLGSLALNDQVQSELGCNVQIFNLLTILQKKICSQVFVYLYKSNEKKRMFVNTLTCKVKKSKEYVIQSETIVPGSLLHFRKSDSKKHKDFKREKEWSNQLKNIYLYEDISEEQFKNQCKYAAERNQPATFRIFFTKTKYANCDQKIYQQHIEQCYDNQKIEFQLFFIDYKRQNLNANQPSLTASFKKFVGRAHSYGSLSALKDELQNRNQ